MSNKLSPEILEQIKKRSKELYPTVTVLSGPIASEMENEAVRQRRNIFYGGAAWMAEQLQAKDEEIERWKSFIKREQETYCKEVNKLLGEIAQMKADYQAELSRHELAIKELTQIKGMQFVKVKERNPENSGYYCLHISGGYMGAYYECHGKKWEDTSGYRIKGIHNCEWLDKSSTLPDAKQEAIAFGGFIRRSDFVEWGEVWVKAPKLGDEVIITDEQFYSLFKNDPNGGK
jgi:hypothetical protein